MTTEEAKVVQSYKDELMNSRRVIVALLDKAWELGGYTVGEKEFESYDFVKNGRQQIIDIDKLLNK